MNKTVASVIDDINEWKNPHREGEFVYYVTAFFTDGEVGSAGRKDMDAALEVRGLLQEAIGQELDFTLEPKAPTKSGKPAWKILGFGTPGGAATYTAPGVQGSGERTTGGGNSAPRGTRSPEQIDDIRRAVALKAAALWGQGRSLNDVLHAAAVFNAEWLSDASSAYPSTDSPSVTPAGASEDSGVGVESEGKEPAPTPHEYETVVSDDGTLHQHDWQPHPNLHGWLTCECGENRKKYGLGEG